MRDQLQQIIQSILLGVEIINTKTHGLGAYLLYKLSNNDDDTQRLFLLNLAFSEFIWNLLAIVRDAIRLAYLNSCSNDRFSLVEVYLVVEMALATGVTYINYTAMLFLTVDRLFHIILHLRYDQYWNRKRTKLLLIITWGFNIVLSIAFVLLTYFEFEYVFYNATRIISLYIPTILYFFYIVICIVTYYNMFMVHARSEIRRSSHGAITHFSTVTFFKIFRKSRFFISVILIGSYMMLTVIPGLIRSLVALLNTNENTKTYINMFYLISARISHSVHGAIYIFLQSDVRNLLCRKLRCKKDLFEPEVSRRQEPNVMNGTFQESIQL